MKLDDILAQDEARLKEAHQHAGRYGHEVLVAPGIPYQDGAMLPWLEDAHALFCDLAHLRGELRDVMHT